MFQLDPVLIGSKLVGKLGNLVPRLLTIRLLVFICVGIGLRALGQDLISGPGLLEAVGTNSCVASNNCPESGDVWITNVSGVQSNGRFYVTFTIAGGSNGLPYDVFSTLALTSPLTNSTWTWMGQGYANVTYVLPLFAFANNFLLLGTPVDSDHDGLTDAYELLVSHSNPYVSNSINPGLLDGWAVVTALNPFGIYDQQEYPGAPFARLGHWGFNTTNFASDDGQLPLVADALLTLDWSGLALAMTNSAESSQLIYPVIETNGLTDFNCANGTIRFWFQPNWSTGTTNAPPIGAIFFLIGDSSAGSWGMNVNSLGTNAGALIQFASFSNGYAQPYSFQIGGDNGALINFQSNLWYQITLTYSPTNIALYTNGVLLATGNSAPNQGGVPLYSNGNGIIYYPAAAQQTSGFAFGCGPGQPTAVRGQLDELESFNYPLTPEAVAAGFPTFAGSTYNVMQDSDYDGRSDLLEILVDGTNPNDPGSVAHCRLGYWRFDSSDLPAEQGQLPAFCQQYNARAQLERDGAKCDQRPGQRGDVLGCLHQRLGQY